MDNSNDNSSGIDPRVKKENEFIQEALKITTQDIYKEVFRCAMMVGYCTFLILKFEYNSYIDYILLFPAIIILTGYIIGNIVIAIDPEPYIKDQKRLILYKTLLNSYKNERDSENE